MSIEELKPEITAYENMLPELMEHHYGKHVVIKDGRLIGAYDSFDNAAHEAIKMFGGGPYLIRKVCEPFVMPMPSSILYRPHYANN